MIRVKVTDKFGGTWARDCKDQAEVGEYKALVASGKYGKPERWVREGDEDVTGALETRQVEVMGEMVTEYRLAAEYSIVEEDIAQELEQQAAKAAARALLASTDWLIIREVDTGIPCPADVKAARAAAREVL